MAFRRLAATLGVGLAIILAIPASCSPRPGEGVVLVMNETVSQWALVFVGIATLAAIWYQSVKTKDAAIATQHSAEAMRKSVELQKVAMDQWVDTDDWKAGPSHIQPNVSEGRLPISFRTVNPTKFPLTLRNVMVWVDRWHICTVAFGTLLLPPKNNTMVNTSIALKGVRLAMYREHRLALEIGGVVSFVDAFKERKEQSFGLSCVCGPANDGEFDVIAFTPPDEEEQRQNEKKRKANI